ncbi:hypothetical protein DPMN_065673 [Dreissena polymorpha]|uniref:Uncharacterized protein n=1 Tax=Dreissena polymorpha TaxID=45954 RepID=A0A9D3YSL3_DREPO|nr:hypothetical protein DPMN_065673 [Dreissena polymorpha]
MGENVGDKLKFVKRDAFARGFMACAALSSRGKSVMRIIPKRDQESTRDSLSDLKRALKDELRKLEQTTIN